MKCAAWLFLLLSASVIAAPAVLFQSAPGRFEIAASDATAAQPLLAAAESAWQALAGPLDLPGGFPTPIYVRVVPPSAWRASEPFRVLVEAGGLVSLRVRGGDTPADFWRRGVVQALLLRKAVALHGVRASLTAPLWLELAGVGASRVGESGSELDGLQQAAATLAPAGLEELFAWQRGDAEPRERAVSAYWLWVFLQAESARGGEWRRFLGEILGGAEPLAALATSYPDRFADGTERDIWWITGWHHHRRTPTLPLLDAAESRARISDATRVVVMRDGREVAIAPADWRGLARSRVGREVLRDRAGHLAPLVARLHPFYRNTAGSLLRLLAAADAPGGTAEEFARAQGDFEQDWRDAGELEAESGRALDALERR